MNDEQQWRAQVEELECVSKRMQPSALEIARARHKPKRVDGFWMKKLRALAEWCTYVVICSLMAWLILQAV